MKILNFRVMRGPNLWSIRRHKLIVMRLDLEELEHFPTNKIPHFLERMDAIMPSLVEHRCSEGCRGGFYMRVTEGTWMGHVIEHIALEMQTLAGMDTGFGRTRGTGDFGVYNVVYSYIEEKAGIEAGKMAFNMVESIIKGTAYDLAADLQKLREMREDERLGPSTGSLVEEAAKRGIPYMRLNKYSLVQLGYGVNQQRIQATIASTTSNIAVEIACDKEDTKSLLDKMNIPVPKGTIVTSAEGLKEAINDYGFPLVLKPINGNHGKGATIGVKNEEEALQALTLAQQYSRSVIVEQFVTGHDYRLLVINYKFVAAAKRTPAAVTGDGQHTIQQLVDITNKDPRRGYGHEKVLTSIKIDTSTMEILQKRGITLDTVLPAGEEIYLKATANLSTGGTATDVTDIVHPYNVFMAERIARVVGLDICGIDLMGPDISVPMGENGAKVLEVNAAPGFRMHLEPTIGLPRNVAEPVIDMLYPPGKPFLIPIIAITGTNGKTTTTRLIAHIIRSMGTKVGMTTSDGVYIQNRMLEKGDCTGPHSAQFVLMDPTVEVAVLETARGGLLRSGLGFSQCDVAIVTNVASDHLGMKDIHSLEDLARVKGVVPETVKPSGYAILNADDDLVYGMGEKLSCKIALFSLDEHNPRIVSHCENGGIAAVVENGYITILKGTYKLRIEKFVNIPLTFDGRAMFNVQNILPAVLACFVQDIKMDNIRIGLETFIPSPGQTPGRMNIFKFKNFEVLVDYAHNPHGLRAVGKFLEKTNAHPKVGIVSATGDRRDEDIRELGEVAAGIFDIIVLRNDKNLRGRQAGEITELVLAGIRSIKADIPVHFIEKEVDAIDFCIKNATPNSFIMVCSDSIADALAFVKKHKEDDSNRLMQGE
ncbi:MAG: cyanophycin synthetase [Bacteroidia bacterium]